MADKVEKTKDEDKKKVEYTTGIGYYDKTHTWIDDDKGVYGGKYRESSGLVGPPGVYVKAENSPSGYPGHYDSKTGMWSDDDNGKYNNDIKSTNDKIAETDSKKSNLMDRGTGFDLPNVTLVNQSHKLAHLDRDESVECYIKNLITGTTVKFRALPDELSESIESSFEEQPIRGRSEAYQGYSNTGPYSVSFDVTLYDDYCENGIQNTINNLKALAYPDYSGTIISPLCYVRFGNMISMKAIVSSVSISRSKPYRDGVYLSATVGFEFTECENKSKSVRDIEAGR